MEVDIDVAAQTYDATVNGIVIAQDYAFRLPETSIGQLDAWHASGGVTVANLVVSGDLAARDPACSPSDGGDAGADADTAADADATDGATVPDGRRDADAFAEAPDTGPSIPDETGGCGCTVADPRTGASTVGLLLLLAAFTLRSGPRGTPAGTGARRRRPPAPREAP